MEDFPFLALQDRLRQPQRIALIPHQRPDADALGSVLGLGRVLAKCGHQVSYLCPSSYQASVGWLPGMHQFKLFHPKRKEEIEEELNRARLVFCLDWSELSRIGEMEAMLLKAPGEKVVIDHHLNPTFQGDLFFGDVQAPATALLVYRLLELLHLTEHLDKESATCLYAGLSGDTGSFQFGNTTRESYEIAGLLLTYGIDLPMISRSIYADYSFKWLRFLGYTLSRHLMVLRPFKTAYIAIPKATFERFNLQMGDTEGIVHYALGIKGMTCGILLTEQQDGHTRLSFRSIGDRHVNTLAAKYFKGGGHLHAAGGRSSEGLEATVRRLKEVLKSHGL